MQLQKYLQSLRDVINISMRQMPWVLGKDEVKQGQTCPTVLI